MASVPGPDPDRPFPRPGPPAESPHPEPEEERRATEAEPPDWIPEPYDPERERVEPDLPAGVP